MGRHTKPQTVIEEARRVFDLRCFLESQDITDPDLLAISIESETDFSEFITTLVKADGEESAEIAGREAYIKELKEGLDRKKKRHAARRALICAALTEAGEKSFSTPAGTVSIRSGRESVEITDEMNVHKSFWKPQPDKVDVEAISAHLKARAKAFDEASKIEDEDERSAAIREVDTMFPPVTGAQLTVGIPFVTIKRS